MILNLLFAHPLLFVVWIAAIIYAITIHEFAHAAAAKLEGDQTAESLGRFTLNPLAHLDPWGFLLLLFAGFGWGRPVPFNPFRVRHTRFGPALISLAGPVANLLSVVIFGFIHKFFVLHNTFSGDNFLMIFLGALIQLNAILAVFNLIPVPPLDGSKLLFAILPQTLKIRQAQIFFERYGALILIGIIVLDSFSSVSILSSLFQSVSGLLGKWFA
jgi:Zn-dependent protease